MRGEGRHARPGAPLPLAVAVSLGLHAAAIGAAVVLWHPAPDPPPPYISVTLVAPQDMPPPALVRAREPSSTPEPAAIPEPAAPAAVTAPDEHTPMAPPPSVARESLVADAVAAVADRTLPATVGPPRTLAIIDHPEKMAAETLDRVVVTTPAAPPALAGVDGPPRRLATIDRPRRTAAEPTHRTAAATPAETPPPAKTPTRSKTSLDLVRPALSAGPALAKPMTTTAALTPIRKGPRYGGADLANPAPRYPYLARRRGQEGRVILRVLVGAAGDAKAVSIRRSSGYRLLDEAALKAVGAWRFVPARVAERPVAGAVDVPVSFRLTQ